MFFVISVLIILFSVCESTNITFNAYEYPPSRKSTCIFEESWIHPDFSNTNGEFPSVLVDNFFVTENSDSCLRYFNYTDLTIRVHKVNCSSDGYLNTWYTYNNLSDCNFNKNPQVFCKPIIYSGCCESVNMNADYKAICSNLDGYYDYNEDGYWSFVFIGVIIVGFILIQLKHYHEHYGCNTPCKKNDSNNINNINIDNNSNNNYHYDLRNHRLPVIEINKSSSAPPVPIARVVPIADEEY